MPREPNALLAGLMSRTGFSNSNLAAHVRRVAQEHGADLKCTHVDVRRWLDGVIPRAADGRVHRGGDQPQGRLPGQPG